jgi:hypothetical protein
LKGNERPLALHRQRWNASGRASTSPAAPFPSPTKRPSIRQITKVDGKWTVEELQFLAPNFLFSGIQNPAAQPDDLAVLGRAPTQPAG